MYYIFTLFCFLSLIACTPLSLKEAEIKRISKGPSNTPIRNITNFSASLRCMDNLFIDYDVAEKSVLIEEFIDKTGSVKAGAKDMLVHAIANMNKKSERIKLITVGQDLSNMSTFAENSGNLTPLTSLPDFGIRGAITQIDRSILGKQADFGFALDNAGFGASKSAYASHLGIDLSVVNSEDLAIIPHTSTSNSVIFIQRGKAMDMESIIKKSSVNFSVSHSRNEGSNQALRNLVEFTAIELFGKLFKVPYWQCLGIPPDSKSIQNEVEDWYYLLKKKKKLSSYVAQTLHQRGFNQQSPEQGKLTRSVSAYLDYISAKKIDHRHFSFFNLLLNEHRLSGSKQYQHLYKSPGELSIKVRYRDKNAHRTYPYIELYGNKSAYHHCFYVDEKKGAWKIFPHSVHQKNFVPERHIVKIHSEILTNKGYISSRNRPRVLCYTSLNNMNWIIPNDLIKSSIDRPIKLSMKQIDSIFSKFTDYRINKNVVYF